jgi:hypothetical protein
MVAACGYKRYFYGDFPAQPRQDVALRMGWHRAPGTVDNARVEGLPRLDVRPDLAQRLQRPDVARLVVDALLKVANPTQITLACRGAQKSCG